MTNRVGGLTPDEFVKKWSDTQLPERAASQEHFLDLCRLLGQPTPDEADPTGADYFSASTAKASMNVGLPRRD